MHYLEHRLENGLQIVAECNDQAHSAALGFFVRTGARDEHDEVAGVSHFLEHMVFKGTASRSAEDVNREFDDIGAHYNAFTSEECTVYYAAVLPELLDRAVDLLADILRPALRTDDFTTEKKVIIEEIRMYHDQPPYGADEAVRAAHFGDHPLGRSVLGTETTVGELPVEAMRDYFSSRYSPSNIVVAAAGRVDFDAFVRRLEQRCGSWEPRDAPRPLIEAVGGDGVHAVHHAAATQQYLMLLGSGPSARSDERFAARLLTMIVGDDSGSRFFWELVDPGLVESASLYYEDFDDAGLMMNYISCNPNEAARNLERVDALFQSLLRDGVTAEELVAAKSKLRSRIVLGSERPRGRMFVVGTDVLYRRPYQRVEEILAAVDAVTADQVREVARSHQLPRHTMMSVGPLPVA